MGGKFNFIIYLNRDEQVCCSLALGDKAKAEIRHSVAVGKLEDMASEITVLVRDMMVEMVGLMDVEIMKDVMSA